VPAPDHRLERRASLLATKVKERVTTVRDAVAGPGERPPFTAVKPRSEVLDWWRRHIDDEWGKRVLDRLSPQDQMDLRVNLARHIEQDPAYPPEDLDAGIDDLGLAPPGTTPMPSASPPMGPPPTTPAVPPSAQPVGLQPPFA
jgi:hypothetical protein